MAVRDRIDRLDLSLFDYIESQTTAEDRRSLLALHRALARAFGTFSYLEIGSFRGGTLQVMVSDDRCAKIVSIDPRPEVVPDDRHVGVSEYPDNSTESMLDNLRAPPGADIQKILTIEASSAEIDAESLPSPDFCLIDGEHTHEAALRDARFCRSVMPATGVIAFHDFDAVPRAVVEFIQEQPGIVRGYPLRDTLFVVEFGSLSLLSDALVRGQVPRAAHLWSAAGRIRLVPALIRANGLRNRMRLKLRRGTASAA